MNLPELTHLQYATLLSIGEGWCLGRQVRENLKINFSTNRSDAGFYQLMRRLEEAGLVRSQPIKRTNDDRIVAEKEYRITPSGIDNLRSTREFYNAPLRKS